MFMHEDVVGRIEFLQFHKNQEIQLIAVNIINKYFEKEEGDLRETINSMIVYEPDLKF